jgi:pimeloyl-ACP methyl ester carboxylesterase
LLEKTDEIEYINIRGTKHYYQWIRHNNTQQTKPVMVFLHGWGGSARYWESTAEALADDFDCLLYDLRGFGRSTELSPDLTYEMEDYADDLAILLDAFGLDQVYLNSHSMGASVAVVFLNRHPNRVKKAILTCSGIFDYNKLTFSAFHQAGTYVVKFRCQWFLKVPFADQLFMARFLHRPIPKAERRAFLEDFLQATYDAATGTIYTSVSKKASEMMPGEFSKIPVPTLLVAGEKDIIIPAEMGCKAASLNENVEYFEIPNTAHFPMLEAPDTYLKKVREFLL